MVGGGVIGTACALELALLGASVTLLEKDELAAGASGRNLGYLDTSKDPVLAPLSRRSLERYLEVANDPPVPVFLDREPLGTLAVTIDENEIAELRAWAAAASEVGVRVEHVDEARELEPELTPGILEAYRLDEGHRVDPLALTVCLAALARQYGATVSHHRPVRRLLERGERVTGVLTDDEVLEADEVVVAAGPWSAALLRPLGITLPVAEARGWLVHAAPDARPAVRRPVRGDRARLRGRDPRRGEGGAARGVGARAGAAVRSGAVRPAAVRLSSSPREAPVALEDLELRSIGSACSTLRSRPTVVVAVNSAFTTASSTASIVARNRSLNAAGRSEAEPSSNARTSSVPSRVSSGIRFAVENAIISSPEPLCAVEPVRASPSSARTARRRTWCGSIGASVATTQMHEPSECSSGMRSAISAPTGTPSIRRFSRSPKFVRTSAPTVYPAEITLDAVPMPPLKSMHCIPVPAPTHPSATSPFTAESSAS